MRILLIGASGQLGRALGVAFADAGELVETAVSHARRGQIRLDLADRPEIDRVLAAIRPDLVLLAGAMCHVDGCELDPAQCRAINTEGPAAVASYLAARDGAMVFF